MSTLTLDVPAPLAARLSALPTDKAQIVRAAALDAIEEQIEALEAGPLTPVRRSDLPASHVAAIERGLAQMDAGQGIPGEIVLAELREMVKTGRPNK